MRKLSLSTYEYFHGNVVLMSSFIFGNFLRQKFLSKKNSSLPPIVTNMDSSIDKSATDVESGKAKSSDIKVPVNVKTKIYGDLTIDNAKAQKSRPQPSNYDVQKWFPVLEGKAEGKISAKELQNAFKVYQNKHFSDNVCKFVVRLFDLDKNGGVDIREFEQIYTSVKQWVTAFNTCDRARSGFLTDSELDLALKQMNINFSPDFVTFLINRCDPVNKKMSLDQFIVTCVQMQKYTDEFRARDEKSDGVIKLRYEDFLELLMKSL